MKIEKIIYEKDNNNVFNKCIVYHEDGTSEVTNDVLEKIFAFMDQEGLDIENVMNSPKIINGKIDSNKKNDNIINETIKEDTNGVINDSDNVVDNKKRGNGKMKFIKITSLASALVIAGAIASHFLNKNKSSTFSRNKEVIEQSIDKDNFFVVSFVIPSVAVPSVVESPLANETSVIEILDIISLVESLITETLLLSFPA